MDQETSFSRLIRIGMVFFTVGSLVVAFVAVVFQRRFAAGIEFNFAQQYAFCFLRVLLFPFVPVLFVWGILALLSCRRLRVLIWIYAAVWALVAAMTLFGSYVRP